MAATVSFGPFRLDPEAGSVWQGDTPVRLAPRPFALLRYLAEHPGRLLSKEELLDAVWPGAFVSDAVLKETMREVRRALDDPAGAPRFIETVHGRGYRFRGAQRGGRIPGSLTALVGRREELAALRSALAACRLVTLHGTGGAGKTRLARQAASDAAAAFGDGVWWLDLSGLDRPDLVVPALGGALGIRDRHDQPLSETLAAFVRSRELLLVLDSCEHVLAGCVPIVERLLAEGPRARVLATSREPLGIPGEKVLVVPPLGLPAAGDDPASIRASAAVELFVERARDADATFECDDERAPLAAAICRRLDGLPLAIELVAARAGALPLEEILARVEEGIEVASRTAGSGEGRHHSVAATVAWSAELLSAEELGVFTQLSVFGGTFCLRAVAAVCEVPPRHAASQVGALVSKSLVSRVATELGGEEHFRLLDVVRGYAHSRMQAAEGRRAAALLAAWCAQLASVQRPLLNSSRRREAIAVLSLERDNFRAALRSSLDHDPVLAVALAGDLWWWWMYTNQWREGRDWLEAALELSPVRDRAYATAALGSGALAWFQGDLEQAERRLAEAVQWSSQERVACDVAARAHDFLGHVRGDRGDLVAGLELTAEAVCISRQSGDSWGLALGLIGRGNLLLFSGSVEEAAPYYQESAELCRRLGDHWVLGMALRNLGIVARRSGATDRSLELLRESLAALRDADDSWFVSRTLEELGETLALDGLWERAATVLGAAEALREAVGAAVLASRLADYTRAVAEVRQALGSGPRDLAWTRGRAMGRDAAIDYALSDRAAPPRTAVASAAAARQ